MPMYGCTLAIIMVVERMYNQWPMYGCISAIIFIMVVELAIMLAGPHIQKKVVLINTGLALIFILLGTLHISHIHYYN